MNEFWLLPPQTWRERESLVPYLLSQLVFHGYSQRDKNGLWKLTLEKLWWNIYEYVQNTVQVFQLWGNYEVNTGLEQS